MVAVDLRGCDRPIEVTFLWDVQRAIVAVAVISVDPVCESVPSRV